VARVVPDLPPTSIEERVGMSLWDRVTELGTGSNQMDGVFVPIPPHQRELLERTVRAEERDEEYWEGYADDIMQATHWFVYVAVPELDEEGNPGTNYDGSECTWWDFGVLIAKQDAEGNWEVWGEDPGDTPNIWYQSTYTKEQAYQVREHHLAWANAGKLYNELTEKNFYLTSAVYEDTKVIMPFW